jgi:hypothetical protein
MMLQTKISYESSTTVINTSIVDNRCQPYQPLLDPAP